MKRTLGFSLAAVFVLACGDHTPTSPVPGPQGSISDGAHTDPTSNPDFFFLPPMVPNPASHDNFDVGEFNGKLNPQVQICEGTGGTFGDPCAAAAEIAFFTTTTGPGSETVRLVEADEHYIANWHTDLFDLMVDGIYRVRVFVGTVVDATGNRTGGRELGFADVKIVTGGAKNAVNNEEIPLKDGRTLPVIFRIENNALCFADDDPAFNPSPCSSETVDLSDGVEDQVELRDETTGDQIGVLSIPPGQILEPGSNGEITFTLQLCDKLNADIPQFGDCLRITADPPLTEVVGADGLDPFATISLCRIDLLPSQNDLITVHRQDEETGQVFALPHTPDDCEDIIPAAERAPAWDAGREPAGDSPYTSLFRNALPAKMEYSNPDDAERSAAAGDGLTFSVKVTDASNVAVTGGNPPAQVRFTVTEGQNVSVLIEPVVEGVAKITRTLNTGTTTVLASGVGLATLDNNGPGVGFDPFWPGLHEAGVEKSPVLLGTGTLEFIVTTAPTATETVDLSDGVEDQVELRDENGNQIGVLTIPPGQALEEGQSGQITFTLELCEELDADIPQFGDCLRITSDPPLTVVVGADGLVPPATISLCRIKLLPPQNDLMTVHRQDENTGEVFALPHAADDCEGEVIIEGPSPSPQWDAGREPAGDSPYTSLFRNAIPVQMDPIAGTDGQVGEPGQLVGTPPGVVVTDRDGNPQAGATVHFQVVAGSGTITPLEVVSNALGNAQLSSWQLGIPGENRVRAFGKGIAGPGSEPFMPDLPTDVEPGLQEPVLLGTGEAFFRATATEPDGSTIFRATFTGDALDGTPGAPDVGAWIFIDESAGTIRVRSAVGDIESKPVELNQVDGLGGGVNLVGTVAGTSPTTGRWLVRWRSLINSPDAFFAPIVLRGSGAVIASLEYRSAGQITYNSPGNDIGIDWTQGVSQLFEIVVDLDAKVTSLSVNGAPVSGQQNVPFVQAATTLDRVGAELGGASAQVLAWDNIVIQLARTVDGILSPGEWDGATVYGPFTVDLPDGGTTTATLRMDNNHNSLFTSLQFERDMSEFNLVIFAIRMDEDQDGAWDLGDSNGEDGYVVQQRDDGIKEDSFHDEFFSCNVDPCQGQPDTQWGGTNDGGTASTESPVTTIEAAHPLNSGDIRDAELSSGQTLKFFIIVNVGPVDGTVTSTYFPGPFDTGFVDYVVK